MPIRRRRRKDKPNASLDSDVGGVRVDGSELHVGRDLIGRDNVQIGSQHTYHLGAAGLAAIVGLVGLLIVAIVAIVVWPQRPETPREPRIDDATAGGVAPAASGAPTVAAVPSAIVTSTPLSVATVEPTIVPTVRPTATPQLKPMLGRYANILIAPFGQLDSGGRAMPWPTGPRLAVSIHRELERALDPLIKRGDVDLRFEGVEQVAGANPDQRELFAQKMLDAHKASLLVFGNLRVEEGSSVLLPDLQAGARDFDAVRTQLEGAEEIVGKSRLRIPLPDPNEVSAPDDLAGRALALIHFTIGLTYLQAADAARLNPNDPVPGGKGESYYDKALESFDRAVSSLPSDAKGLDVIHLFRGIVYQRMSLLTVNEAEARAYQQALDVNSEYARAYIGLGYFNLQKYVHALPKMVEGKHDPRIWYDPAPLTEAEDMIRRAKIATDKPPEAQIDDKIDVALGMIKLMQAQDADPAHYADAETLFGGLIKRYEAGDRSLEYLVGFAYFGLGAIAEVRDGDPDAARSRYQKVLTLRSPAREIAASARQQVNRIDGKDENGAPTVLWGRPDRVLPVVPAWGKG